MSGLSVVVPTRNRSAQLRNFLASLGAQALPVSRFEVIVVDNGSVDDTRDVVAVLRRSQPYTLRYVAAPLPGLHRARHAGARAAETDLLVFADDDVAPFPSWLAAIEQTFSVSDAVLVGGKVLPHWEAPPPSWLQQMWDETRMVPYLSVVDAGEEPRQIDPMLVWGCNFAIRKPVLTEARGFHPDAMPEELLRFRGDGETHVSRFIKAKGYSAFYHPAASVWHSVTPERMTLDYLTKRAFQQGVSDSFSSLRGGADPWTFRRVLTEQALRLPPVLILLKAMLPRWRYYQAILANAQRDGFAWHQKLHASDDSVRAWVGRRDYLDD